MLPDPRVVDLRKEQIKSGTILATRVDGKQAIIMADSNINDPTNLSFRVLKKIGPVAGFGKHEYAKVGLGQRVQRTAKILGVWNP